MVTREIQVELKGYGSPEYADAFREWGEPLWLPHARGFLLKRPISGTPYYDASNCYPLFTCANWAGLEREMETLRRNLVSLVLVTDPFANFNYERMLNIFPDLFRPFKYHHIVELGQFSWQTLSYHHRRNLKKALNEVDVEFCPLPEIYLNEWTELYQYLIQRHGIRGITAFSRESFRKQLQVPGLHLFRAMRDGRTIGMILWMVQGYVAYYHLAAYSPEGYRYRASYALFWNSIEYFRKMELDYLNLGSAAGLKQDDTSGLARFKRGWATGSRLTYLAGVIFQRDVYQAVLEQKGLKENGFFPAYRKTEYK